MRCYMKRSMMTSACTLILSAAAAVAASAGPGAVTVYDTVEPVTLGDRPAALVAEGTWKALGQDAVGTALQGDAALVNDKLGVLVHRNGSGVDLYAKGAEGWTRLAGRGRQFGLVVEPLDPSWSDPEILRRGQLWKETIAAVEEATR